MLFRYHFVKLHMTFKETEGSGVAAASMSYGHCHGKHSKKRTGFCLCGSADSPIQYLEKDKQKMMDGLSSLRI